MYFIAQDPWEDQLPGILARIVPPTFQNRSVSIEQYGAVPNDCNFDNTPWINLAIGISGESGETAMIWPPVFGLVAGVLVYSLIAGVAFSFLKFARTNTT